MAELQQVEAFWPILVSIVTLWIGGLTVAIGLTMWIMGRLSEQNGARVEMKEVLLLEIRQKHDSLREHIDQQHNEMWGKINELAVRMTRVETQIERQINARDRD